MNHPIAGFENKQIAAGKKVVTIAGESGSKSKIKPNTINVVIGRFQPFHIGHESLIDMAIDNTKSVIQSGAKAVTLVMIGSANKAFSFENPMTARTRAHILTTHYGDNKNIIFRNLKDYDYDNARWEEEVHKILREVAEDHFEGEYFIPTFFAGEKDDDMEQRTSWARGGLVVGNPPIKMEGGEQLSATEIRKRLCSEGRLVHPYLPFATQDMLCSLRPEIIEQLQSQYDAILEYKSKWANAPYPPVFMATDAVVFDEDGKFMFIRRGGSYGTGALALAGGYLEADLTHEENMMKELKEETGLDLTDDSVEYEILTSWDCGAVDRDARGRISTKVFLISLNRTFECYNLEAGDDAAELEFLTLEEVENEIFFSDHEGLLNKVLQLEEMGVPYIPSH